MGAGREGKYQKKKKGRKMRLNSCRWGVCDPRAWHLGIPVHLSVAHVTTVLLMLMHMYCRAVQSLLSLMPEADVQRLRAHVQSQHSP